MVVGERENLESSDGRIRRDKRGFGAGNEFELMSFGGFE